MDLLDQTVTDSILLKVVKAYIDTTGEGRLAFVREIQSLAEQCAHNRIEDILSSAGVTE